MRVEIEPGVRLFVDVDGAGLVPDGMAMVERPTVVVVRLCDALDIHRPVVLGASFGGFVAQRYLARHPNHPSKVVLACTSARLDIDAISNRFRQLGGDAAGTASRQFFGGDISVMPAFLEHCIPLYSTEPLDPNAMARAVMNPELMTHFFVGEATTMGLRAGLAAAACPVLVLAGELDPVMPPAMVREMVDALPPGFTQFEELPGVSHLQVAGRRASELVKAFIQKDA